MKREYNGTKHQYDDLSSLITKQCRRNVNLAAKSIPSGTIMTTAYPGLTADSPLVMFVIKPSGSCQYSLPDPLSPSQL